MNSRRNVVFLISDNRKIHKFKLLLYKYVYTRAIMKKQEVSIEFSTEVTYLFTYLYYWILKKVKKNLIFINRISGFKYFYSFYTFFRRIDWDIHYVSKINTKSINT